tara:strand:- start:2176 stop:2529 length:354 start_codon:yes stop_codon:yes gene_type:complete
MGEVSNQDGVEFMIDAANDNEIDDTDDTVWDAEVQQDVFEVDEVSLEQEKVDILADSVELAEIKAIHRKLLEMEEQYLKAREISRMLVPIIDNLRDKLRMRLNADFETKFVKVKDDE